MIFLILNCNELNEWINEHNLFVLIVTTLLHVKLKKNVTLIENELFI